jgi:hypothetical protein
MSATTTPTALVLDRLTSNGAAPRPNGSDHLARCPAHEDRSPSLSVSTGDRDQVLLHCFAGCSTDAITSALGLESTDLWPERTREERSRIVAKYDYLDETGGLLFQVVRLDPKSFRQRRPDGRGGWTWKVGNTRRVLYRLPEVLARGDAPVFIVEGEKDADALADAGCCATTSPGGAKSWSKVADHARQVLADADVIVVADRDEPGYAHAREVAASLLDVARSVIVVEAKTGKDAADHLGAGHAVEDLPVLASDLPEHDAPETSRLTAWLGARPEPAEPRPAVTPEDGAALLDDVETFVARFCRFPTTEALTAVVLWLAHAHVVDAFDSTPRLALLSPEPGSGKTRALEVAELLTPEPMHVLNASTAACFRSLDSNPRPTLLFDEVDAIFGRFGNSEEHEDLRGLLNAGHRNGATIPRCVGTQHEVKRFPVFAAVALAGLGDLPDTLMTRSVVVRMRRRLPSETVEPFRHRLHEPDGHAIRERLAAWADAVRPRLADAWPEMPPGIEDRPADVWEPLLAVADAAGGAWPERARTACLALAGAALTREASLGVRLLRDLREVFGEARQLPTSAILDRLHALEEAPWSDLRGQPLDPRGLARMLGQYDVRSTKIKVDGRSLNGFRSVDLHDAWTRYVPSTPEGAELPEPPEPTWSGHTDSVPDVAPVPEPLPYPEPDSPPLTREVPEVPEVLDLRGDSGEVLDLDDVSPPEPESPSPTREPSGPRPSPSARPCSDCDGWATDISGLCPDCLAARRVRT